MSGVPTVSVVVPVYQGSSYLKRITESCSRLRQIHCNLAYELILVCDDPLDNSSEIAFELETTVNWIRVISLASNSGQHVATAAGMLHASGDWILTIDEDLQFNPEQAPYMLRQALESGLDIVYARNVQARIGTHSYIRNIMSTASKRFIGSISKDDYTSISSFRIIRSEIAQGIAFSVDQYSYLDTSLFSVTTERRRGVFKTSLSDTRPKNTSGYSFARLLAHYGRFVSSAKISSLSLLMIAISITTLIILTGVLVQLLIGIAGGSRLVAPGWASQVGIMSALFGLAFGYLTGCIKLLSVLVHRTSGVPSFIPVDRRRDKESLEELDRVLRVTINV